MAITDRNILDRCAPRICNLLVLTPHTSHILKNISRCRWGKSCQVFHTYDRIITANAHCCTKPVRFRLRDCKSILVLPGISPSTYSIDIHFTPANTIDLFLWSADNGSSARNSKAISENIAKSSIRRRDHLSREPGQRRSGNSWLQVLKGKYCACTRACWTGLLEGRY